MKEENLNNLNNFPSGFDKSVEFNHNFAVNRSTLLVNDIVKSQQEKPKSQNQLYGKSAIAQVLVNISFPCNKEEIIKLIGDKQIEYRKGYLIKIRDAIRNCFERHHTFESSNDVISSISTYLDSMGLSERVTWLNEDMF